MVKKLSLIILSAFIMTMISGCWAKDIDQLEADLKARAQLNQDIVDKLVDADLIEKSTGETLKESISDTVSGSSNIPKQGITWYLARSIGCWSPKPTTKVYIGGSFPYKGGSVGSSYGDGKKITDQNNLKPIPMVGVDQVEMLKKELAYKVWVLKLPEEGKEGQYKSLDELTALVELVKREKSTDKRTEYFNKIDKYFYNTNEPLLDPEKDPIIKETKLSAISTYHVCDCDDPDCKGVYINAPQTRNYELGYDIVLKYHTIPVATLRILEFNREVVNKLIDADGADEDKYLRDPNGKRVFLLEYPVNYVEKIETDGKNNYKSVIKESDIRVNIYNGKLKDKQGNELRQRKNQLIHIGGGGGTNEPGTSSFVVHGKSKVSNIGFAGKDVESGAVVLRDYLELMYMPNVVDGDNIIAPGRRIRIINFEGDISRKAALFIDMSGRVVERVSDTKQEDLQDDVRDTFGYDNPAHEIYVTDLVDLPTVGDNGSKSKIKPANIINSTGTGNTTGDGTGTTADTTSAGAGTATGDQNGGGNSNTGNNGAAGGSENTSNSGGTGYITDDYSGKSILSTNYVNSISPTCRFPSDTIASSDVKNETNSTPAVGEPEKSVKMIFYGILTDKNPFETAMYSGWINTDDEINGSLSWWNDWLNQNDFIYKIDPNNLDNAFMGDFQFDMAKEGFIVFNIDTLSKIQRDMDNKQKGKEVNGIRSAFIILGFILMAYSMLLLAAWAFDCVILTGFNLLSFLTFGKWVAVRSTYDIPNIDSEGKYYVDFQKALISCAVIMGVGFLLTVVDVIEIVSAIIEALGGITNMIDRVIFKN